jgi:1-deoxy-D-xylulose-5-phosphate reductoisomerase
MKKVVIIGSTGSIGRSALELFDTVLKDYSVLAISANTSAEELSGQVKKYSPKYAVIGDPGKAAEVQKGGRATKVLTGAEGLIKIASLKEADIVLIAAVGAIGLIPLISAARAGKTIAMANKEALVMAGDIVLGEVKKHGATLLPVDSEHSAVFQCLQGGSIHDVKRLIITASGGPLKNLSPERLKNITPEQALAHPTWKMGKKITIDSATLMNKGLEVIEAHYLFGLPYEKIDVIIHPQSIIHSMVEYVDGAIMAQMSHPDMRLPILYALTYPERRQGVIKPMSFGEIARLEFLKVNFRNFPCFSLAISAGKKGGTMPAVMNAANEAAVHNFLDRKIRFDMIPRYVARAMAAHRTEKNPGLDRILRADLEARARVEEMIND